MRVGQGLRPGHHSSEVDRWIAQHASRHESASRYESGGTANVVSGVEANRADKSAVLEIKPCKGALLHVSSDNYFVVRVD
jgi:hypothetical protein